VLILEFKNNELLNVHVEWLNPMEKTSSLLLNHLHNGISIPINDTNNIPICLGTNCLWTFWNWDLLHLYSKQFNFCQNIHTL
jgi:hypothetical protein